MDLNFGATSFETRCDRSLNVADNRSRSRQISLESCMLIVESVANVSSLLAYVPVCVSICRCLSVCLCVCLCAYVLSYCQNRTCYARVSFIYERALRLSAPLIRFIHSFAYHSSIMHVNEISGASAGRGRRCWPRSAKMWVAGGGTLSHVIISRLDLQEIAGFVVVYCRIMLVSDYAFNPLAAAAAADDGC